MAKKHWLLVALEDLRNDKAAVEAKIDKTARQALKAGATPGDAAECLGV